ncbi:MAG: glutamine synthetase [Rhodospirillaceae bacterium]|nr:glutamine synthetase [Rhodospirillaceae bacterium]MBT6138890.1 glutamine synthetase [Rhodospirillaceae bacterium]
MEADQVKTAADAIAIVEERGLTHVKVGVFDMDGVLRGKYMGRDKFVSALDGGFGFCDVVLGWDSQDQLYDNVEFTGWHTGYPDATVRVLPQTCREIPWEDDMLFFLSEFVAPAEAICPRGVFRSITEKAAAMGYTSFGACEYEFFVFDETPHSVREKGYKNLNNITPGFFGYSMLRSSVLSEFYTQFLEVCEIMDFPIEGLHTETGPGVLEAAIQVDEGLAAADKAALFKTFTKIFAQRNDLMATFMAKWSMDWPGQSGHIHLSLQHKDGGSVFHDPAKPHNMSDEMRWFIGGQQALLPELLAMVAQTVNAYTRLIPGFWAPTDATWGVENRTTALRAIPGSAKSQRVEYRLGSADANPYIAMAAALGSGLWGIENKIEPTAPVEGNAYEKTFPRKQQLSRTLWDAAQALKKSKAARALFGDAFVEHYAASREWEEREFRRHVTDWEMERYFEII